MSFPAYALDNSKSCSKCWQLFSAHLPCLFRKTAFLLRPSRGGAPRRILISVDEAMEAFILEEATSPAKSVAREDRKGLLGFNYEQYAVEDLSTVVDGQTSVSWRRTVRESESGGCCSFGPSDDLRVYAPMSFSLVFAAEVFDLQADTAATKGEWMEACQAFIDHLQSPAGKAFRGLILEARRRSQAQQVKQAQVSEHVARSKSTQDNIRKKYQLPSSSPATRRPPGVEELILD